MSAIYGVLHPVGRPVGADELAGMREASLVWGGDADDAWRDGPGRPGPRAAP